MRDDDINPLEDTESEAALAYAEERKANIRTFVRTSPDYYIANFDKVGASARFTPTFNAMAGLFGLVGLVMGIVDLFKEAPDSRAMFVKLSSGILSAVFVWLCVRSFIQSRKRREAQEAASEA